MSRALWRVCSRLFALAAAAATSSPPTTPPPLAPLSSWPQYGVWVIRGNNAANGGCVTEPNATSFNGRAIATQCCDGTTCRRYDNAIGNNDAGCMAGTWGSAFTYTTWAEAQYRCAKKGWTVCDSTASSSGSCSGKGCAYNSLYVWTSIACPHPPSPPPPSPPTPPAPPVPPPIQPLPKAPPPAPPLCYKIEWALSSGGTVPTMGLKPIDGM
eukprot:1198292-Prymnesium_polylepis.2